MSELFVTYSAYKVTDVPITVLKQMVEELINSANFIMAADLSADETTSLVKWTCDHLALKHKFMPVHHLRAAISEGSLGQRGGTTKLIPRNVAIWISEQDKIYQEQYAARQRHQDEERRRREQKSSPRDGLVGTAVRIKISWLADGRISSEQYDSFPASAIYERLKMGVPESEVYPRDFVKDYGKVVR